MHVEAASGFRDVAVAKLIDALNMLPTHAVRRHGVLGRIGLVAFLGEKSRLDRVGVGRLCQIIDSAELHRGNSGRDISVTRQHDNARFRPCVLHGGDDIKAVAVFEPKIDDSKARLFGTGLFLALFHGARNRHVKAARFHGAGKPRQERDVVIDEQECPVFRDKGCRAVVYFLGHFLHVAAFHVPVRSGSGTYY